MTDERDETSGEERIDDQGRNPTQQRMDEEGVEAAPVDASWTGEEDAGDSGLSTSVESPGAPGPQANEPIFEPDVPLVAEVNREAGSAKSRKGVIAAVAGGFAVLGAAILRRRRG